MKKFGYISDRVLLFAFAALLALATVPSWISEASALVELNCRGCHNAPPAGGGVGSTAPRHHSLVDSQGKQCLDCHQMVLDENNSYNPVVVRDCIACHGQLIHQGRHHALIDEQGKQCLECHRMVGDGAGGVTPEVVRDCSVCHIVMNPKPDHNMALANAECIQCHNRGLVDEHLSRSSTCYTCHSSSSMTILETIMAGKAGTTVYCTNCHGSAVHQNAHDGKVVAPYTDCNSCHLPNLVALHDKHGFQCAACHASGNAAVTAAVQKGLGGQSVVCADCHNSIGGFGNHAGQHDKVTLLDTTGFIAKHEEAMVYCTACHTSSNATYQQVINDGMAGIQQPCNACHSVSGGTPGNQAPTANAGADKTAAIGQAVSFTGTGTDPDGTIVNYQWNFGDGTSATGQTVTKTYAAAGIYTVTLTVTDNGGAMASDTAQVTVTDVAAPVFADQVQYLQRLRSVTSYDSNSSDITSQFRDSNLTDRYLVQNNSDNSYVVAMKLNRDALTTSKVVLRIYVSSLSYSRTLRIYPYQSGGTSVNTSYYVSYSVSSTGWKEIDVTSIAQRMNGYGWMKFRITTTSSSLYLGEGNFLVQ